MKKGTSMSRRTFVMAIVMLAILVVFATFMSYVFYSDALVLRYEPSELEFAKKQFFVITITAEVMVAIILAVIMAIYVDVIVTKPIKAMSTVLTAACSADGDPDALENLNVKTGDEVEELYRSLLKYKKISDEAVKNAENDNWMEQHDYMTMLDNRELYEKRIKECYSGLKHIFVACISVLNLDRIKEKLGPDAEESILQKVSCEMRRIANDTIHAYKMDGADFVMVCTEYNDKESRTLLDSWAQRVGRLNRESDDFKCSIVWGGAYGDGDFKVSDVRGRALAELEKSRKEA